MTEQNTPKTVRIDTIYIAEQFARMSVTLEYLKEAMEKQSAREDSQDKHISQLSRDVAEVKSDVRFLKDVKPKSTSPFVIVTAVVAASAFGLSLLNQLYGASG